MKKKAPAKKSFAKKKLVRKKEVSTQVSQQKQLGQLKSLFEIVERAKKILGEIK